MKPMSASHKHLGLFALALGLACAVVAMQELDWVGHITLTPNLEEGGRPGLTSAALAKSTPAAAPTFPEPQASENPLTIMEVASLNATQERPLFSSSRRPPMPAAAPAQLVPTPVNEPRRPALSLVGVVAGEGDAFAIFLEEKTKAVVRLKAGESHAGWTLRDVGRREATLERGSDSEVLAIVLPAAR